MAFGRTSVARLVSLKGGWFGFPRFHSSTTSVINLTGGIRIDRNVGRGSQIYILLRYCKVNNDESLFALE